MMNSSGSKRYIRTSSLLSARRSPRLFYSEAVYSPAAFYPGWLSGSKWLLERSVNEATAANRSLRSIGLIKNGT